MANSATVYARIDPKLKSDVDKILDQLGVTPSQLIQMLYSQIKLTEKIPFEIKIPKRMKFYEDLTQDDFDEMVKQSTKDIEEGRTSTFEESRERIMKKFK